MASITKIVCSLSLLIPGCAPGGTDADEDSHTASTSADNTSGEDTDNVCAPADAVSDSSFAVGNDRPLNQDQSASRPNGRYLAECSVDGVRRNELPELDAWELFVDLVDCSTPEGQDTSEPFSMSFMTDVIEGVPLLNSGRRVAVDYTIEIFAPGVYQSWYSLRDAATEELLLAAFSDHGPEVGPALEADPKDPNWLLPFHAELGDHACPPDPRGCFDPETPRQRFLDVCQDAQCWQVVGTSAAEVGNYVLHLGFAGDPDVCDFGPSNNAIEGILVRL